MNQEPLLPPREAGETPELEPEGAGIDGDLLRDFEALRHGSAPQKGEKAQVGEKEIAAFLDQQEREAGQEANRRPRKLVDELRARMLERSEKAPHGDRDRRHRGRKRSRSRSNRRKRSRSRSKSSGSSSRLSLKRKGDRSIQQIAEERPGYLAEQTLRKMRGYLADREIHSSAKESGLAPVMSTYLATVLQPSTDLGMRSSRELMSLAQAGDQIIRGEVDRALDTICQRFKSVECAHGDKDWGLASQLELIPDQRVTAVSARERRMASSQERLRRQVAPASAKGKSMGSDGVPGMMVQDKRPGMMVQDKRKG
eukprot:2812959-Amphidinium_carterae.3